MRTNVTVIPSDSRIIVDGTALHFSFPAPEDLHALQWHGEEGHLEIIGEPNQPLTVNEYPETVAPFVAMWEEEKARLDVIANRPPTLEETRASALATLRNKRKSVEYGGFLVNGQRWDSEQKDELRLNSAIKMFEMTGMPEFQGWKIAEETYLTVTLELLQAAALALMQHYATAFAVETAKEAEIKALQTADDITAWLENSLNQGWPRPETP